jgi:hypothetical protein
MAFEVLSPCLFRGIHWMEVNLPGSKMSLALHLGRAFTRFPSESVNHPRESTGLWLDFHTRPKSKSRR